MFNEFRQDLVSGEWVLLATGRAKRPDRAKEKPLLQSKADCPFEDPEKAGNIVIATYPIADFATAELLHRQKEKSDSGTSVVQHTEQSRHRDGWFAKVAKNKFPAVVEGEMAARRAAGPFSVAEAQGLHELVILGDHTRALHQYSPAELGKLFGIYQERFRAMAEYAASRYILIFHNKGARAGASLDHPHSQIISLPILPPDVKRSIFGAENFYKQNNQRAYDVMLEWEIKESKRVIHQTDNFVAFCPFVSKTPYEVRIFPRVSHAHFERCPAELLSELGGMMAAVLKKIHAVLADPDFNFFIHTAPVENTGTTNAHQFYSWHIELLPKSGMIGAFELGSGIDVNVMDPDQAAAELRPA